MILESWATDWSISAHALNDLKVRLGMVATDPQRLTLEGRSEAAVSNRARLRASGGGGRLWRNNLGVATFENGDVVRYGLCNDSAQLNREVKSSDLIGITPVRITSAHLGMVLGVFTARECKQVGWKYTGVGREKAQLAFIELVNSMGGDARFLSE